MIHQWATAHSFTFDLTLAKACSTNKKRLTISISQLAFSGLLIFVQRMTVSLNIRWHFEFLELAKRLGVANFTFRLHGNMLPKFQIFLVGVFSLNFRFPFFDIRVIPAQCSVKICPRHPVERRLIPRTGIVMLNLFLRNTILHLIYNSSS